MPKLRILVSGRASVPGLELGGRMARNIHLTGLDREDAAAWLQERGVDDPIVLERVLGAALAIEADDPDEADRLLALVDADERWADRPEGEREAPAVQAARVRLTVDLAAELELSDIVRGTEMLEGELMRSLQVLVTPGDVMLPSLSRLLGVISERENTAR